MAASDLCSLGAAKLWLNIQDTNSDQILSSLITAASRMIYSYLSRPSMIPQTWTDRTDGAGAQNGRLFLKNWPVISVTSLLNGTTLIPAATPPSTTSGYPNGYLLDPWDGVPPGTQQYLNIYGVRSFWPGPQSITTTYVAGYQVTGESWVVPSGTNPEITVNQPYGPWASDGGVIYAPIGSASGIAFTRVPTGTAIVQGQYALDVSTGSYDFSSADIGATVLITYGFVPQDIVQACVEIVAEAFSYKGRIGARSKSLGGQETMSWDLAGMNNRTKLILNPYMRVIPFWS